MIRATPVHLIAAAFVLTAASGAFAASVPNGSLDDTLFSDDTAVVGYEPGRDADVIARAEALGASVIGHDPVVGFLVFATPDPAALVRDLAVADGVRYAERDPLIFPEHTPNDSMWLLQWGMRAIKAPVAWDSAKGDGAVVAVLDTGVEWEHPDLLLNVWTNEDEIPFNNQDDDGNGYFDDVRGWDFNGNTNNPWTGACVDPNYHGTHVAGIVAATQDNALGTTGTAPGAKVMPLRVLCGSNHLSAAALAVRYAADNGANVVSCSWYATYTLTAFEEAVAYGYNEKNVLFVKSAGNQNGGPVTYPGTLPEFMAVSSISSNYQISSFSSQGAKVEIAAPGSGIWSTVGPAAYSTLSGTSMAAPHVSGVAALVWSVNPSLTNVEVRDILTSTAWDLGAAGRDPLYGYGLVQADAAVAAAQATLA